MSNLGGTFPRIFVLKLVDYFTKATCNPAQKPAAAAAATAAAAAAEQSFAAFSCALEQDKHRCTKLGGNCHVQRDGYYITNVLCIVIGIVTFWGYIKPAAARLSALPLRVWREYERS